MWIDVFFVFTARVKRAELKSVLDPQTKKRVGMCHQFLSVVFGADLLHRNSDSASQEIGA
jgi:hypothetical protein